jgi:hypothetical protein
MNYTRNNGILVAGTRSALRLAILSALAISVTNGAFAGSATWKLSPTSGDWNTATNWTPETVPNGLTDVATFQQSNVTSISTSAVTNVGDIVFDTNASAFTINPGPGDSFEINGTDIINNSGETQQFVLSQDDIFFENSASAGDNIAFLISQSGGLGFGFANAGCSLATRRKSPP